jgi:hypothetical protein
MLPGEARHVLCDRLHHVADQLAMSSQTPLRTFEIDIRLSLGFFNIESESEEINQAIAHGLALLKPLRRIRTHFVSIFMHKVGQPDLDLIPTKPNPDDPLQIFLVSFRKDLKDVDVLPPRDPLLTGYSQLTELVSQMRQHPYWLVSDHEEMRLVLRNGRSARESDDREALKKTYSDLWNILKKWNEEHENFVKQMKQSFQSMPAPAQW